MQFLDQLEWVAVDTETTGINPWKREIIEIGAVRFSLKGVEDQFQVLIKPKEKQDPKARAIHNISNEELEEKGVSLSEGMNRFFEFIKDDPLVFHNAPFDVAFIYVAVKALKLEMPTNFYYDSLYLSRSFYPDRNSHSLVALRELLQINTGDAHRALSDAKATAHVFRELLLDQGEELTSRKKYNKFLRFHRKLSAFKIFLPKNLDEIEKYFGDRIRRGEFIKIRYKNRENQVSFGIVRPMELMIFNQNIYVRSQVQMSEDEELIPLRGSTIYDPDLGPMKY